MDRHQEVWRGEEQEGEDHEEDDNQAETRALTPDEMEEKEEEEEEEEPSPFTDRLLRRWWRQRPLCSPYAGRHRWLRAVGVRVPRWTAVGDRDQDHEGKEGKVDRELGEVVSLALPVVASNLINFLLSFVNLLFVGHVGNGEVELAAAALAITFTNVTGLSVGTGLLCAMDTLCSQAYGAENYKKVGQLVQRAVLIVSLACVPFAAVWISSEWIFRLCRLAPELSALAGRYCMLLLPGLWFYMIADVLRRWLQTQSIVRPVIYAAIGNVIVNTIAQYVFVYKLEMGFDGSPVGMALAWTCSPFLLLGYIVITGAHRQTWHGWSRECLREWGEFLKLAVPSTLMLCAEWWGFEITVIAVGWIGEVELAAHTVAFNTLGICFMIPLGMSVGNLLGAGDPYRAKRAAIICIMLTMGAQTFAAALIFLLRNIWGSLYSNDPNVVALVARVLPLGALLTGVCGGVLRGAGKQKVGAVFYLFALYLLGLPTSLALGFATPLAFFGIWLGLIFGVMVITGCLLLYIFRSIDWGQASTVARQKAGVAENIELPEMIPDFGADTELAVLPRADFHEVSHDEEQHPNR